MLQPKTHKGACLECFKQKGSLNSGRNLLIKHLFVKQHAQNECWLVNFLINSRLNLSVIFKEQICIFGLSYGCKENAGQDWAALTVGSFKY